VRVGILLTAGKRLHDHIISIRDEVVYVFKDIYFTNVATIFDWILELSRERCNWVFFLHFLKKAICKIKYLSN